MYKITCCLVFILTNFTIEVFAQSKDKVQNDIYSVVKFELHFPDKSNNHLFNLSPELEHLSILYQDTIPYAVYMHFNALGKENVNNIDFYDLDFEGDKYLFRRKYNNQINFILPKINFRTVLGKDVNDLSNTVDMIWARVYKDSIIYSYEKTKAIYKNNSMDNKETGPGIPAKYNGDLKKVADSISRQFTVSEHKTAIDSVLIYEAVVQKFGNRGVLNDIKLIAGKPSSFSTAIETGLQATKSNWKPAFLHAGRNINSKIKIYAKLNEDGSVTIQTPRMLGVLTDVMQ